MTDLATIPAIRAEAERLAREFFGSFAVALSSSADRPVISWGRLTPYERAVYASAQATLLCDLSRPASRDAIARLVAGKLGWAVTATAPELTRVFPGWWALGSGREQMIFCEPSEYESDPPHLRGHKIGIAGITAIPDPAEALAIIARRVLGGEE